MPSRPLRIAALVELASLVMVLANLATVHWAPVVSLLGPVHGGACLFVIGAPVQAAGDRRTRLTAVLPGIGGLLVIRRLRRRSAPAPRVEMYR